MRENIDVCIHSCISSTYICTMDKWKLKYFSYVVRITEAMKPQARLGRKVKESHFIRVNSKSVRPHIIMSSTKYNLYIGRNSSRVYEIVK